MRFRRAVLVVAFVSLLAFGCANPGYDRDATRDELVDIGLTDVQARCVRRGLERRIGDRRLNTHAEPTESEIEKMVEVLDSCNVDASPDQVSSDQDSPDQVSPDASGSS